MRSVLTILLLTLLSIASGCASQQTTSREAADPSAPAAIAADTSPLTADSATLVVYGMGCPLCANNVDLQLKQIHGVSSVEIDLGSGEIRLEFAGEPRPSPAALAKAVVDSGFTLVRIDTP